MQRNIFLIIALVDFLITGLEVEHDRTNACCAHNHKRDLTNRTSVDHHDLSLVVVDGVVGTNSIR